MGKECCVGNFASVKQKLSEQMGVLEFYSKQRNEVPNSCHVRLHIIYSKLQSHILDFLQHEHCRL